MTLPALCICAIIGVLPLLFLPELPPLWCVAASAVIALFLLRWKTSRSGAVMCLCFCWGIYHAHMAVQPANEWTSGNQRVQVVINSTDGENRHEVTILKRDGRQVMAGPVATLYGNPGSVEICSGQRWDMVVALRPVHGQLNDGGFDNQRYALSQRRVLTGRIINATLSDGHCGYRGQYIAAVKRSIMDLPWRDVILALGFGERLNVSDEIKTLMRDTGTAHLMAISGLHIALAGSIGWGIARMVQWLMPVARIGYRLPLLVSLAGAAIYTWLAGSNPPALRTLVSLAIWGAIRLSNRQWNAWQVWGCCVGGMLLIDPLSVLSESLWLSALAVAALIFWYQWVPFKPRTSIRTLRVLYGMLHLQLGVTLLLMPLQLFLFHGISITSLVANLFAVPAVTFISVPLIFAGMVTNFMPFNLVVQGIWWLADRSLASVFYVLKALPAGWVDIDSRFQWLSLLPWGAVIVWRLRLWLAIPGVLLAVIGICLFPLIRKTDEQRWAVHMLDIGHGLAIVIERNRKAMLYDTGNAWPGGDSAKQTIIPWLRWHGLVPEGIILSHEHLDHRGGMASLLNVWPHLEVRSSLGWEKHLPCERGQHWVWQGLTFTAHWPLSGNALTGNNRSCVVTVADGKHTILLTGDIEAAAELAMLKHHWQQLHADVIQVPHHGSTTSSSVELLRRVNAQVAIASVARFNPWHLPSRKVIRRYIDRDYIWHDTAHSGQITLLFTSNGRQLLRYREHILPRWYHQWFGVPADSR